MRRALAISALALASACGGSPARSPSPERPRCPGATCDPLVPGRGLAAVALDDRRIAFAVLDTRRHVLRSATVDLTRGWDPEHVHPEAIAVDAAAPLAFTPGALAYTTPRGITLHRDTPLPIPTAPPTSLAITWGHAPSPQASDITNESEPLVQSLWLAWTTPDGAVEARRIRGDAVDPVDTRLAPAEHGTVALASVDGVPLLVRASSRGVETVLLDGDSAPRVLSEDAAHAVAAATAAGAAHVAWADAGGVSRAILRGPGADGTPERIDDGRRRGEPAHTIGAALSIAPVDAAGGSLLAYQDQTEGSLVIAAAGVASPFRRSLGGRYTRAFETAIAAAAGRAFVLDVAIRRQQSAHLRSQLFLTEALPR